MPTRHRVPPELRRGPFDRATGLAHVTAGQLRGPAYDRLSRGVYTRAGELRGHRELIRGLRRVLPPNAVLGGLSAATALGAFVAGERDRVEIVLPADRRVRRRPELVVRGDVLAADEVVATPLGPATSGARTAFDLARRLAWPAATTRILRSRTAAGRTVPALPEQLIRRLVETIGQVDAVLRATGTDVATVEALARNHAGVRGAKAQSLVLAYCDPRAESFPESAVRVRIALAGLPPPVPQYEVRDTGGAFVARVDFGWPELRLALEYDGAHHNDRHQFSRDRTRDNRLHLAGWRVLHVDALHLRDPAHLLRTLAQALALPPSSRSAAPLRPPVRE